MAVTYTVTDFVYNDAINGKLCAMVSSSATSPVSSDDSTNFKGVGIVKIISSNGITLTVDSVTYEFDRSGACRTTSFTGWKLMMAEANENSSLTSNGIAIEVVPQTEERDNIGAVTRSASTTQSVVVDDMNARDQFAVQAMQAMMQHIKDPSVLSDNEVNMYCQAAYQWAANMMLQAAKARTVFTNTGGNNSGSIIVQPDELTSNTEKLLNNMIVNNQSTVVPAYWIKTGQSPVVGDYTDAVAQNLPNSGTAYANIAAAEADGWSWHRAANNVVVETNGSSTDLIHIGDSSHGRGESTDYPFFISGKSGTGNDELKVAVAGGIPSTINIGNGGLGVAGSPINVTGGGPNVSGIETKLQSIDDHIYKSGETDTIVNYLYEIQDTLSSTLQNIETAITNSGKLTWDDLTPLNSGTISAITDLIVFCSGLTYTPYRLTTADFFSWIEGTLDTRYDGRYDSRYGLIRTDRNNNTFPTTAEVQTGHYYRLYDDSITPVILSSVNINLPAVSVTNNGILKKIVFHFTCSPSSPPDPCGFNVSVNGVSQNPPVRYKETNLHSSGLAGGTYEVECEDNGVYWVIGATKLVS